LVPLDPKQAETSARQAVDADLGYSILARLQDVRGQLGLAEAVFTMQVLREAIAKRMAHLGSFHRAERQTVNDLHK
jgi:hypothetical protein